MVANDEHNVAKIIQNGVSNVKWKFEQSNLRTLERRSFIRYNIYNIMNAHVYNWLIVH